METITQQMDELPAMKGLGTYNYAELWNMVLKNFVFFIDMETLTHELPAIDGSGKYDNAEISIIKM